MWELMRGVAEVEYKVMMESVFFLVDWRDSVPCTPPFS